MGLHQLLDLGDDCDVPRVRVHPKQLKLGFLELEQAWRCHQAIKRHNG